MDKVLALINSKNYDVRVSGNARFMDQKVTPDVLSIVADCILQFIKDNSSLEFTSKDIWTSSYAMENVVAIFNKPNLDEETARSEYDKFFAQPLKTLSYSGILDERKVGNKNYYKLSNKEVLEFIAIKERNALNFLISYISKVMKDSEIWTYFEDFFEHQNSESFESVKVAFKNLLYDYTNINRTNRFEPSRIFTKVLNPIAYYKQLKGTARGFVSEDVIGYDELMYNRKNWRDISKRRDETRQEFEERKNTLKTAEEARIKFTVNKAKRFIRERYYPKSEVQDRYAVGDATQVHHIFPEFEYPQIKSFVENLILLTATQHSTLAHPQNHTRKINKDYQLICLLAKSDSVDYSLQCNDGFYSKEDFVYVLNEGITPIEKFEEEFSLSEIKTKIVKEYESN